MTLTSTEYKHIQLNENNIPIIAGTTMKVVELITSVKAYGWTPTVINCYIIIEVKTASL